MKIEKEPFQPPKELVRLVKDSIKGIRPDSRDLCEWHESYVSNHTGRIAFDVEIVKNHVPLGSKILEIGSVPLILTSALSGLGYDLTGVDIAPERYNSSLKRIQVCVLKCNIENGTLPLESSSYDAIIFFELFEHLRINLIFTLREATRVLKPNGLLLLSTPNLKSLGGIRNYLFQHRAYSCSGNIFAEYEKLEKIGHMGHVREYTTVEVNDFLRKMGFEIEKIIFRGNYSKRLDRLIIKFFPSLRPFVTYVTRKKV